MRIYSMLLPPAFGGLVAIFGIPQSVDALPHSLASSSHGFLCVGLWVQISPFYKHTVILG